MTPVDETEFEDLPSTEIEVETHVQFGMTGSYPLRIAELFFASDGLHIVEYGYITPLFGLAVRKHKREAAAMESVYDVHGLDEVLLQGDSVVWLNYDSIDRVVLHDGGRVGRPKIAVHTEDDPMYAYRLHDTAVKPLATKLVASAERHGFDVERDSGLGFDPRENLRRFFRLG